MFSNLIQREAENDNFYFQLHTEFILIRHTFDKNEKIFFATNWTSIKTVIFETDFNRHLGLTETRGHVISFGLV